MSNWRQSTLFWDSIRKVFQIQVFEFKKQFKIAVLAGHCVFPASYAIALAIPERYMKLPGASLWGEGKAWEV